MSTALDAARTALARATLNDPRLTEVAELNLPDKARLLLEQTFVRAYRGRPGCGCGCNGVYFEDEDGISAVLAEMFGHLPEVGAQAGMGTERIFYYEGKRRYLWLYTAETDAAQ